MKKTISIISSIFMLFTLSNFAIAGDELIKSGGWTKKGYSIKGDWKIVNRDAKRVIVFEDNFKTKNGPDLKVYLSSKSIEGIEGKSVVSSSINIGELSSNKGYQEYEIPDNVNLDEYSSLLIHCEAYTHLWGGASIK